MSWRRLIGWFRRPPVEQPIPSSPRVHVVLADGAEIALPPDDRVGYVAESLISPRSGHRG